MITVTNYLHRDEPSNELKELIEYPVEKALFVCNESENACILLCCTLSLIASLRISFATTLVGTGSRGGVTSRAA